LRAVVQTAISAQLSSMQNRAANHNTVIFWLRCLSSEQQFSSNWH